MKQYWPGGGVIDLRLVDVVDVLLEQAAGADLGVAVGAAVRPAGPAAPCGPAGPAGPAAPAGPVAPWSDAWAPALRCLALSVPFMMSAPVRVPLAISLPVIIFAAVADPAPTSASSMTKASAFPRAFMSNTSMC